MVYSNQTSDRTIVTVITNDFTYDYVRLLMVLNPDSSWTLEHRRAMMRAIDHYMYEQRKHEPLDLSLLQW